ncbi:MAG: beta-N-acetylhexosaminidase [Gammaproteobacteria bacterium]|jgi:beta-N-acetylhexosaminidase|nr:beta-N-acetylhexosaminidase [Gammaproteobacteria bacterium]
MKLGCIMMDLIGVELTPDERQTLLHPHIGGVLLFSRNYQNCDQLKALIQEIRRIRDPLLIAVDQEGGRVQRFKEGFTRLPALSELGMAYISDSKKALQQSEEVAYTMASQLLAVGVDISFSPVLDLDYGVSEVIGNRSFHRDPEVVTLLATAYVSGMKKAGMQATGKHFPGHGAVVADSHTDLPIDSRSLSKIFEEDLLPFAALKDMLWGIMPAHVRYVDADDQTAGFSSFWLKEVLREEIGFQGAIISDDLSMAAAAPAGETYLQRAEKSLAAGCDMIIVSNNPAGLREILSGLSYDMPTASEKRLLAGLG